MNGTKEGEVLQGLHRMLVASARRSTRRSTSEKEMREWEKNDGAGMEHVLKMFTNSPSIQLLELGELHCMEPCVEHDD